MYQAHDQADRAASPRPRGNRFVAGVARRLGLMACALLMAPAAQAVIAPNQVNVPAQLGVEITGDMQVDWSRTSAGTGDFFSFAIPAHIAVDPATLPAGCVSDGTTVTCTVPDGPANGSVVIPIRGVTPSSDSITVTGNGGISATQPINVIASGDLAVTKTRVFPAAADNPVQGGLVRFEIKPEILAGANNVPAGATIRVIDTLPGTAASFTDVAVTTSGGPAGGACTYNAGTHTATCTYPGPFAAANLASATITLSGRHQNLGTYSNTASIASVSPNVYPDRNDGNNTGTADYTVGPGTDIEARGDYPSAPVETGSSQTLRLTFRNNGPATSPAGGLVQTIIPAAFTLGPLPAGCTNDGPGTLVTPTPAPSQTHNGTLVTCAAGVVPPGAANDVHFDLPLTASTSGTGLFPVVVTPAAGMPDGVESNNAIRLTWQTRDPNVDLVLDDKSKRVQGGSYNQTAPVAPGTVLESRIRVRNHPTNSTADLAYSPANPIVVVDYLHPREIEPGSLVVPAPSSANWACTESVTPPALVTGGRTVMVTCRTTGTGTLVRSSTDFIELMFQTTVAAIPVGDGPLQLTNMACTGGSAVTGSPGLSPILPDTTPGNDCASRGGYTSTPIGNVDPNAQVNIVKEVSVDGGGTWLDANTAAVAPLVAASQNELRWRIRVTTPSTAVNVDQQTIPTLQVNDTLPGIITGNPAYLRTPAVGVGVTYTVAGAPVAPTGAGCPALSNNSGLGCSFTNVAPDTQITIELAVQRPFRGGGTYNAAGHGLLQNTARLFSPDALLTPAAGGALEDTAWAQVARRVDLDMQSKTANPANPRVGETIVFTLEAFNRGPFPVPVGQFEIYDDLHTGAATLTTAAYEIISINGGSGGGALTCGTSPQPGDITRVSCVNAGAEVNSQAARTVTITARVKKPVLAPGTHVPDYLLYDDLVNTAHVRIVDTGTLCEWHNDAVPANSSTACNDAAATGDNSASATMDVQVPRLDLQQQKERVLPAGQSKFTFGDTLRYRFTLRNYGPSRAERVEMTDVLTQPSGAPHTFTLIGIQAGSINAVPADGGMTLAAGKVVTCSQPGGANTDIACWLAPTADDPDNHLDGNEEINFVLELAVGGPMDAPVLFSNSARVCSAETGFGYEPNGEECVNDAARARNNLAAVNDHIVPPADLAVTKTTVTPGPVDVGQPVQYSIVLRNNGTGTTTRMRMTDVLPSGFEWMNTGAQVPAATAGSGASLSGSGALVVGTAPAGGSAEWGGNNTCYLSAGPATVTAPANVQTITCDFDGSFPTGGEVVVTLWAQPKTGVYDGSVNAPFLVDRTNVARVSPGIDDDGQTMSEDSDPTNNESSSPVQVDTAARLGGRVFFDQNHNGDQNAPVDTAIAGVTISLTGTDVHGNTINLTTTTDASGDYRFVGLPPSDANGYTITQTQPAGYDNGTPQPNTPRTVRNGTSVGTTPAGADYVVTNTATTSVIDGVVLVNGADGVQFDFPEYNSVSLSGRVYEDVDLGDSWTPGVDVAIPNATVDLLVWDPVGGSYVFDRSVTTDANGEYAFSGLDPALTYAVRQPVPTGFVDRPSAINPGLINGAACVAPSTCAASDGTAFGEPATTSMITGIVLDSGNGTEFNFGEMRPVSVSGRVFLDLDNDGVHDAPGEPGITGVRIELTGVDDLGNPVNAAVVTDGNGNFSFEGLRPGIYSLVEPTQPPGTANGITTAGNVGGVSSGTATPVTTVPSRIDGIDLSVPGSASVENLFGEIPTTGAIGGRVWLDLDNDGVIDAGEEGIPGVPIRLVGEDLGGNVIELETVTDADGNYYFGDLPPGTYMVIEPEQPAGTRNGITVPGSLGGQATTPDRTPSYITQIVLGLDQVSVNNNFGEIPDVVDLVVSKTASAASFQVGQEAGYVIRVRNAGQRGTVGLYTVEDRLPPGVVLAATPAGNGWTCTGDAGDDGFQCTSNQVLAGGATHAGEIEVRVDVLPAVGAATVLNNAVLVEGGGELPPTRPTQEERDAFDNDPDSLPVCDPAITQNACRVPAAVVRLSPDLVVSKAADTEVFTVGKQVGYAISVRNQGQAVSDGEYVVRDRLPAGLVLAGVPSGTDWSCTGAAGESAFQCRSDVALAPDAVHPGQITLQATVLPEALAAGEVNNAVVVAGGGEDPSTEPTPDEEDAFTNEPGRLPVCDPAITQNACRVPNRVIAGSSDMVVSKSAETQVFTVGTEAAYQVRVRNIGNVESQGEYVVEDRLPAGIVLAGTPSGQGWTCTGASGDTSFRCVSDVVVPEGELHPGVIRAVVQVLPAALGEGPVNNAVIVSGGGEDPGDEPTPEERDDFERNPEDLPECDSDVSQNACRVPNEVRPPEGTTLLNIAKRGDRSVVEVGDIVLYTVDIRHAGGPGLPQVDLVDRLPHGFTYIDGSARVDGAAIADPAGRPGPVLVFDVGDLPAGGQRSVTYRVRVGVGAAQGDGINRAQAHGCWNNDQCVDPDSKAPLPGSTPSNSAEYKVTIRGGVFAPEACVLGKVFVDCNNNHVQDEEELGIPGVRMYFSDGTWLVSDSEGKYSYCGLAPRSHTLKVDPSTLPVGSRLTTSSNRNLGDADSLFLDLKNGELHRADFIEGSCSNPVIEQVKARRTQGEVRAPETEAGQQPLRFESKPLRAPQQATDPANQLPIVEPRPTATGVDDSQEVQP